MGKNGGLRSPRPPLPARRSPGARVLGPGRPALERRRREVAGKGSEHRKIMAKSWEKYGKKHGKSMETS